MQLLSGQAWGRMPLELTNRYRPQSYMRSRSARSIAHRLLFCRAVRSEVDSYRSAAEAPRPRLEPSNMAWYSGACRPNSVA